MQEQFYLIFPPMLWITWQCSRVCPRLDNQTMILVLMILLLCASLAVSIFTTDQKFTFYLLPSRAWNEGFM